MEELANDLYYIEAEDFAANADKTTQLKKGVEELQKNDGLIWIDNLLEYLERLDLLTPSLENAIDDFINRPYIKKDDLSYYSDNLFDMI